MKVNVSILGFKQTECLITPSHITEMIHISHSCFIENAFGRLSHQLTINFKRANTRLQSNFRKIRILR